MVNCAVKMIVTLDDTTETARILIGITANFFRIPKHVEKYQNVSRNAFRWTFMRKKPKLEKISAHLAPVKELARDIVFTFNNERWNVTIHRDLYVDIVGVEGVPDTATDWTVYSGDNSNVVTLITRHVESVKAIDMKVVENLPPETPEPSAKVVKETILGTGGRLIYNHLP